MKFVKVKAFDSYGFTYSAQASGGGEDEMLVLVNLEHIALIKLENANYYHVSLSTADSVIDVLYIHRNNMKPIFDAIGMSI